MLENGKKAGRLPGTEKALRDAVEQYFESCAKQKAPPTPSGLALALGVRTSALRDDSLPEGYRKVINQAMQRIEASMMELLLNRGGIKGMETVLERVSEQNSDQSRREQIRQMSDEEIYKRLGELMPRIQRTVEVREQTGESI